MGNTRNTGYLQNIVLYDENDNITLPARLAVTGTVSVNNTTPYDTTQFSLDVNGGLIVKNINKTAQFVLINSNPATGGNNAFVVHTVGGTSASSYADIQGYYGTSIAGSTVLRLNPQGGNVLVGSLAGTGNRMVVASATGVLSTQAIVTLGDLSGVSTARALTINGTTYDLSADRTWTLYTDNISEDASPVNLWFTNARARAAISVTGSGSYDSATGVITVTGGVTSVNTLTGAVTLTTSNISEGTNLYYTDARVSSYLTVNNYATQSYVGTQIANLVDAAPGTLDTLNELAAALGDDPNFATSVATSIGTKQAQLNGTGFVKVTGTTVSYDNSTYLTTSNAASTYVSLSGSYANPAWITSLAWSKITGAPAFITSYTEVDTLSSVTGRGASTSTQVTFSGAGDNTITYSSVRFAGYNQGGGVGYHGFFEIQNTYGSVTNGKKFFRIDGTGSIQIINSAYTANIFNLTDTGVLTVGSIIKSGGTSSQFLKADGSVDSSTYLTGITSSQVTTALGYTPYNATNPSGYISSYTETDTLASVTGRGATTSTVLYFTGGTSTTPAIHVRSGGTSWSEGIAIHPAADDGYSLTFYRTKTSFTDQTNSWGIGNMGASGALNYFGLIRRSLTGGIADGLDNAVFTVNPNGTFKFGFNPYVGSNVIYHAGNVPTWNQNTTGTANNITAYTINQNVGTSNSPTFAGLTINTGGSGTWGQFVVNSTSLWGDGATLYTTIGAGGAAGVMLFNPHVVWNSGSSCAGIRLGRSGGTSSGKYYEIGTGASDNFFIAKEGLASGTQLNINSSGNATFSGTITASNFSGSSSGTNTGDQTNISGNAATATYATSAGSSHGIGYDGNAISGMGPISTWDSRPGVGMAGFGISWHTGVSISGYPGYGGVRLYSAGYPTHASSVLRLEASTAVYTYGGLYSDGNAVIHAGNISSQPVVTIQDSAPSGSAGRLWWESDTGKLKVYYGSAWVDASPIPDSSLFFAKAGGSITGDVTVGQTLNVVGNTLVQGNINAFGDITAYSSSDARLKDNITVIESPLEKLSKINGVSFNWNDKQTAYEVGKKDIGVIAQEIEEVLPELVTTRDNGYKAVRYEKIVALLIEAVKEQQTQINNLTDKLNNL